MGRLARMSRYSYGIFAKHLVQFSRGVLHPLLTGDLSVVQSSKIYIECFSCAFWSCSLFVPKTIKTYKTKTF